MLSTAVLLHCSIVPVHSSVISVASIMAGPIDKDNDGVQNLDTQIPRDAITNCSKLPMSDTHSAQEVQAFSGGDRTASPSSRESEETENNAYLPSFADCCPSLTRECSAVLHQLADARGFQLSPHRGSFSSARHPSVLLLYVSAWETPHIHYRRDDGVWTLAPGERMREIVPTADTLWTLLPASLRRESTCSKLWAFEANLHGQLELLPNDGHNSWDKPPGGGHYRLAAAGQYLLHSGWIRRVGCPPSAPALLLCVEAGSSYATIAWNPPAVRGEEIRCYNVYREGTLLATTASCTREFTDVSLSGLTTYMYYVRAVNCQDQEGPPSDRLTVRTAEPGKPSAPYELVCIRHSTRSIKISWRAPADHGGAPVRYYRIYRNGSPLAYIPAIGGETFLYIDTTVCPLQTCTYRISAWHDLPSQKIIDCLCPFPAEPGKDDSGNAWLKASVSRFSLEGLLSESLTATAVDMLQAPRLDDGKSHILLQGFNWVSCHNPHGWYAVLLNKLPDIKQLGATIIWLPPPAESVAWEGYMPTRWYNLNSKYGSAEELKYLIREAATRYHLSCCVDVVANHRSATQQDQNGHWTIYEGPNWGPWAVVCNNLQKYKGEGNHDTGTSVECAPDIDHTNAQVQNDMKKWLRWLVHEIGFTALRLDMAGGYGITYQKSYVDSVDRPFAVGEYWDGSTSTLANYVRAGQGSLAAFDFAFYYVLKRCVESQNFTELNACGSLNGLVGVEPRLAVTFIENHDTDHLDYCSTFGGGDLDAVLQGYAVILTHPGTPSVYWNHFSDYGPYCRQKLQALCDVRVHNRIQSTSGIFMARVEWGLYSAYISPGSPFCQPHSASIAMKVGYRDWTPDGSGWKIETCGTRFCVWSR